MAGAVLDTLPLALGIALNPLAIVVSILVVCKPKSRENGAAFVIGWVLGLALLLILATWIIQDLVSALITASSELPSVIWIGLGGLFLFSAVYTLRSQSRSDETSGPRRWMRFIEHAGVFRTLGMGVFLAMFSLRNVALLIAAAGAIGSGQLPLKELAVTVAVFVAISSLGVLIPLLVRLLGGNEAEIQLEQWGEWLIKHMGTMTAAVMVVLGTYLLGRGITGLF